MKHPSILGCVDFGTGSRQQNKNATKGALSITLIQAQAFQMQHLKSLEAQRLQQLHTTTAVPQLHHPPAPALQLQHQLHHLTPQVQAPVRAATNLQSGTNGYQVF